MEFYSLFVEGLSWKDHVASVTYNIPSKYTRRFTPYTLHVHVPIHFRMSFDYFHHHTHACMDIQSYVHILQRARLLALGALHFAVLLVPVNNLLQFSTVVADGCFELLHSLLEIISGDWPKRCHQDIVV
jgi:hypothetical protein